MREFMRSSGLYAQSWILRILCWQIINVDYNGKMASWMDQVNLLKVKQVCIGMYVCIKDYSTNQIDLVRLFRRFVYNLLSIC